MSVFLLKGSDQWETRGVGKVANDWNWSRTVVIDVLLSFNLAAILEIVLILFPFPLTPAEWIVTGLPIWVNYLKEEKEDGESVEDHAQEEAGQVGHHQVGCNNKYKHPLQNIVRFWTCGSQSADPDPGGQKSWKMRKNELQKKKKNAVLRASPVAWPSFKEA